MVPTVLRCPVTQLHSTPALCWAQDQSWVPCRSFSPCGSDTAHVQLSTRCNHNSQVTGITQMCVTQSVPDPKLLTGLLKHLLFLGWAVGRLNRHKRLGLASQSGPGKPCSCSSVPLAGQCCGLFLLSTDLPENSHLLTVGQRLPQSRSHRVCGFSWEL